jgi:hypothetical protein
MVWVLAAVLGVALLRFIGSFVYYVDPPPGSNCTEWYAYCPTGPGDTPLGTAFQFGNASAETGPSGAAPEPGCPVPGSGLEYCETIAIEDVSQGVSTNVIDL